LLAALALSPVVTAAPPPASRPFKDVQVTGEATADRSELAVKGPTATVVIGAPDSTSYRLTAEVQPVARAGSFYVQVMPADPQDFNKPAALHAYVSRDADGIQLGSGTYRWDAKTNQWADNRDAAYYRYWPAKTDQAGLALVAEGNLAPRTLNGRWLKLRVEADGRRLALWIDGYLVRQFDQPAGARGPVAVKLQQGDRLRDVRLTPLAADSSFLPIDLSTFANDRFAQPIGKPTLQAGGVPFELPAGEKDHLNLRPAHWIEVKKDPPDYYEWYEAGAPVVHDERVPLLRVPVADYAAAHVLAVAEDDPGLTDTLSLRAGRFGYSEQVVMHDYAARVPRRGNAGKAAGSAVPTAAGPLFHVRVPLTEAFAQDMERFIEIELTKELRLARRQPDPNRFRIRPLGPASGVRIAALTLERSPLQMRVGSKESGHAFVEPQKPTFQVRLQNITAAEQPYRLMLTASHRNGMVTKVEHNGRVAARQTAGVELVVPAGKRGYHDLAVTLQDGAGRVLLERRTSFALLPPDTRKHRDQSPFGTWDFCGGHYTSDNPAQTGPLYVKLGLRYGMFGYKPEKRKQYGILPGHEPNIYAKGGLKAFQDHLAQYPDAPLLALLFHETAVSGKHLSRVPDLFTDRPPYRLDAAEQKQFQELWDQATESARAIKAQYPKVHLRLGNGALPTKEEMYRHKFPAELFDSGGNESGSFHRLPEAQPPDCVAYNAGLWMDRQMLDAYGYKDKPVTQCYEVCYPGSNPGNLSEQTQADYFARHALHSLGWEVPEMKIGCISDMGNGYYFSNWGATGFCRAKPELNVKPAFVALATLTRVLDGAKFLRDLPLGSATLYGLEFRLPDGHQAYALWTVRGRRPVRLHADATSWKRIDDQGNEADLAAPDGVVEVTLTPSPQYLVGKGKVTAAEPGLPVYDDKPAGKSAILSPLASPDEWILEEGRNAELEYYGMLTPRRKGDFLFESAEVFEGKAHVLRVTPRPIKHGKDTMPMYAVLAHRTGLPVPGRPTEIGLWVNGNSGWGRPIFELQDASGQRWVSLGAQQSEADFPRRWVEDFVPKEMLARFTNPGVSDWNTEDVYGTSRINFDGWRYLASPLPGNYPGEGYPWPGNSQWRWDKDGVVHYPLRLKKLIVELPEKVLHVRSFAPPVRPEVYLKDLSAAQDDALWSRPTTLP
jgi:hypothetical protein